MDENDVETYFYHNIFDLSQSHHRIVRVIRGSNKKIICNQVVAVLRYKDTATLYPPRRMNIFKRELTCLVNDLRDFLKTFEQASKCMQIPLPKPRVEIGSTKSKDNLFAHYYNEIKNIQIDKFVYNSDLETTTLAFFPSKSLKYTAMILFPQKLSTLTIVKLTICSWTDIMLQTSVK